MKKNRLRLFAIIAIIIVVAGIVSYHEFYGNVNNRSNSKTKSGITYPTGNLTGAVQIYDLKGISGSNDLYFNITENTMCLVFLMYTNSSVACVSVYNSTGGTQVNLNNGVASTDFEGQRAPYYSPLVGSNTLNWMIHYNVHLETGGNFNFKIYAANYMLR